MRQAVIRARAGTAIRQRARVWPGFVPLVLKPRAPSCDAWSETVWHVAPRVAKVDPVEGLSITFEGVGKAPRMVGGEKKPPQWPVASRVGVGAVER